MDNKDWKETEKILRNCFLEKMKKTVAYCDNRMQDIRNLDIGTLLEKLKPNHKKGGKTNGGHMPALLLTPHRIVGPAFLGLGVLTIMILSMFAG
jgi:hypothetical protein